METREKPAAGGGLGRESGGLRIYQCLKVRHTGTGEGIGECGKELKRI